MPGRNVRNYTIRFEYMRYKYAQMPPTHGEGLAKLDRHMQIEEVLQTTKADIIEGEELHQGLE